MQLVFMYLCLYSNTCFPQAENVCKKHWPSRVRCKTTLLHWQILTIGLGRDGFENSNKLSMVAHFDSEAVLCVKHTFSSRRDGSLFCRYSTQSWEVWGKRCHRFISCLLVEWANCTTRAAGGEGRFRLCWFHADVSSTRQDSAAHVLTCLRKWVNNLYLQAQTVKGIRKNNKLYFFQIKNKR